LIPCRAMTSFVQEVGHSDENAMKLISNSKGSIIENRTEWVESRASERNGRPENNMPALSIGTPEPR
jgi:hypothetical protein